jgi:signal transduction histidine kinase
MESGHDMSDVSHAQSEQHALDIKQATGVARLPSPLLDDVMDATAYSTVAIGYLLAVLQAGRLTLAGFLLVTAGNLGWVILFYLYSRRTLDARQTNLILVAMIALTCLVLSATWLGMGFDWLLPVATVAMLPFRLPVARAIVFAVVVWIGCVGALALLALPDHANMLVWNISTLTPAFIFCFLFPFAVRRQGEERARAESLVVELEAAQRQLRAYAAESEELAVTRERNRMAREIHDTLGHYLTILAVQLETALKMEEHGDARLYSELVKARHAAAECLAEVRRSVSALRPADLTTLTLPAALTRLVAECEALDPTIEVALDIEGADDALNLEQRLALYRCAQEALTNVRKHAAATKALIRLRVDERLADLTILDNGRGAEESAHVNSPGFGLLGIRERIALLGGSASAQREPDKGWRVQVTLPLRRDHMGAPAEAATDDTATMEHAHGAPAGR